MLRERRLISFSFRAKISGERINIHTQTMHPRKSSPHAALPKSAPAASAATAVAAGAIGVEYPMEAIGRGLHPDAAATSAADGGGGGGGSNSADSTDWKRHSLPSLERASSDNTLDSSFGGEKSGYIVKKSRGHHRRSRHRGVAGAAASDRSHMIVSADDEDEGEEEEDVRTHTSGEELDRFSGYSEEPEPYHPPQQVTISPYGE